MGIVGRKREPVQLDLTALIDVVFILVIFVVLAASFQRMRELSVTLPQAAEGAVADASALTVQVPVSGPLQLVGQSVTEQQLPQALEAQRGAERGVLLQLDAEASVQRAVRILTLVRGAGIERVSIATQESR